MAPHRRYSLDAEGRRHLEEADLLLAVVYSSEGLRIVNDLLLTADGAKPSVLWFMDLLATAEQTGDIHRTLPLLKQARIWAFNSRIQAGLEELFAGSPAIERRMFLGVRLPAHVARTTHVLSPDTRCVMIGNLWDVAMLPVLDAVWQQVCARLGMQLVLRWHAPQEAYERVRSAGFALGSSIRYQGHASNLNGALAEADVAVVAFSAQAHASSPFSRHSFPSRVADFAASGLPVFALCSHDTPLADYLNESRAGVYNPAVPVEEAAAAWATFLTDVRLREACAANARRYAEAHFDLEAQRGMFVEELRRACLFKPVLLMSQES